MDYRNQIRSRYDQTAVGNSLGDARGAISQSDGCQRSEAPRPLTPQEQAHKILQADADHRSLAADQTLMLKMVMPFVGQGLRQLSEGIYRWCSHQGFWPGWHTLGSDIKMKKAEKIALIHSEVSELLEAIRNEDHANEAEEAADIAIRLLDYCGAVGIDLGAAIEAKMLDNYQRPYKHGKAF